jgi:hypothetical protein
MNEELVRHVVRLYPSSWRARYSDEFTDFLEGQPANLQTIMNIVMWALHERVLSWGDLIMDRRQDSLTLMFYGFIAAIAAGVNFYWTVADTPLATAMHQHRALFVSWTLVRAGSVATLCALAVIGIPVFSSMVRPAFRARRWDVLGLLAVPLAAALLTLGWMITGLILSGGHWVPTPWDVTGDWTAPSQWPSLSTRWKLSAVTCLLMAAGFVASAVSLREAVRRSDLSSYQPFWFAATSILLIGSIAIMTTGVLAWGWFAEQYAAAGFHARNGGFFSSTNFASWLASFATFLVAAAVTARGARSALALRTE